MLELLVFLLVGRLIIYLLQKFPFQHTIIGGYFKEGKLLAELFACDLCLGCYLFAILSYITKVDLFAELGFSHIPIISEIITGMVASFLVHIFRIGWSTKFGITIIEN